MAAAERLRKVNITLSAQCGNVYVMTHLKVLLRVFTGYRALLAVDLVELRDGGDGHHDHAQHRRAGHHGQQQVLQGRRDGGLGGGGLGEDGAHGDGGSGQGLLTLVGASTRERRRGAGGESVPTCRRSTTP